MIPCIYDFHVHVGEKIGGNDLRDGFSTLNSVYGLKGVGAFVTEEDTFSLENKLHAMRQEASSQFAGKVFWHLTPIHTGMEDLVKLMSPDTDIKLYTTYKSAGLYSSYEVIARYMQDLSDTKPRILLHCEDNDIIEEYASKYSFKHPFDHSLRRPELAEITAVEKVLDLAVKYDYPIHIVHVSSPSSAILIHSAKKASSKITCETAPHYLFKNSDVLKEANAHRQICSPPFRCEKSRGEMIELLQDGYFDIIATDHCAFPLAVKDRYKDTPEKVPCGIVGLDDLYNTLYENLVQSGKISAEYLHELICSKPAAMMGFV